MNPIAITLAPEGRPVPPADFANCLDVTEPDFGGYLLVFFRDETHCAYFAFSRDGYTFTAVNNAEPVLNGRQVAEQQGVRDTHLTRGPDGFYLAMTDLHIFAQREGLRETEWERDGKAYAWGNNRAVILMKSRDLVHWSLVDYRLDRAFPGLEEIGCAWAPEMFYDREAGKMMVYFTMRFGNGHNKIYHACTDPDFTRFLTAPQLIGFTPELDRAYIDADIVHADGKYHMYLVEHGLKHAVSDRLTSGYVFDETAIVPDEGACEAPNVWKRIGTDKYVLMYDNFSPVPNEMAFRETSDFKTYTPLGRFNAGVMKTTNFTNAKHGGVIPLTRAEADHFVRVWNL